MQFSFDRGVGLLFATVPLLPFLCVSTEEATILMDQPAENKVIEEISFDARVDYDVDELRSEDGAESRRFRSGSMDREEEPGQEDYRPRQLRNYKNDDEHESSEFGRFEISDGEGDDE